MKLYAYADGTLAQLRQDNVNEGIFGEIPTGAIFGLDFDPGTNPAVINRLCAEWNAHRLLEGVLTHNGQPVTVNPPGEQYAAFQAIATGYPALPDWAKTLSAVDAASYINGQIWNGQTQAQVNAWLDANITGTTVAQLRTQVITALKLTAGAVISMRGLFVLTSKLLIYIRDLVIRFI